MGGVFTSTLLTLFVVPVVYLVLDDMKDKLRVLRRALSMRAGRTNQANPGVN